LEGLRRYVVVVDFIIHVVSDRAAVKRKLQAALNTAEVDALSVGGKRRVEWGYWKGKDGSDGTTKI
jgi:hypothetical protein